MESTSASGGEGSPTRKGWSIYYLNLTITDYFQTYQFENLFSKQNSLIAHVGFLDYHSIITTTSLFDPLGFGTTGNNSLQMTEIAAFHGHISSKTSSKFFSWLIC
ncbi:class I chitinase [Medicago truncatula]|uniref:Class I chitinase n=1 Tax=Medicago truncatula TaxID=3880 RepID=G7KBB8_MEDTR|nr:class I chitinase [Medicago truncatula]